MITILCCWLNPRTAATQKPHKQTLTRDRQSVVKKLNVLSKFAEHNDQLEPMNTNEMKGNHCADAIYRPQMESDYF